MCVSHFACLSVSLDIFHILKCVFLIFHDFQISYHIPDPNVGSDTVYVSHFPLFSVFFFNYSRSYNVHFSFLTFFSVSRHISLSTVCVFHFP